MNITCLKRIILISLLGSLFLMNKTVNAQVGINTAVPDLGALLEIESTNKGFLMTRVSLTGNNDVITVTPAPVSIGVMVYNTATAGSGATKVTPGFYYWNGSNWRRFYNQGYTLLYNQTAAVTASSSNITYRTLTGLDTGNITVPFSGIYQIRVEGYYAAGNFTAGSPTGDGASQGSISLAMRTNSGPITTLKETYLTSSSKRILVGSTTTLLNGLAQSATIIYNIDLTAGTTYRFEVRGREWLANNVAAGIFGKNTSAYTGANSVNDAQRGSMSISLIKQY